MAAVNWVFDANARIRAGHQYLGALERSLRRRWIDQYCDFQRGCLNLAEKFALIHPSHYENHEPSGSMIRGPRQFSTSIVAQGISCQAHLVWGYECPSCDVVTDHLFPYSFGGPTIGENQIYLCHRHNQLKGCDIHLYPWEQGEPAWLRRLVECIRRIMADEMR
jgi:hypothetical protein